ncbi:putative transposase [Aminobacter lissarensis]|uniref:Transposase n=1 Tax=Aminobacter carboxidus TaxID=376165 RepID=A0A8E1WKK2_9HYPH|nr:transposase [Aminobacter lissarensis]MBB6470282.1 putative transposase [Aminobacter lissarensis]
MADDNIAPAAAGEASEGTAATKQKSPRRKKATVEPARPAAAAPAKTPGAKRKTHSDREKAEKLDLISKKLAQGKTTLQEATKSAGISVQSYYQWKRNEQPSEKQAAKGSEKKPVKAVSGGNDLAELVQLEAENNRLRGLLAEKLKAENVELRKRLGLD